MYSMTGYGKAEYKGEVELTVEVKTVNNRYLDLNCKYPRVFLPFDDAIRKCVQAKYPRGHMDMYISFRDKREKEKTVAVDLGLAKAYYAAANQISSATGVENDLTATSLMRFADVIAAESEDSVDETLKDVLLQTVSAALDRLNEMRKVEGEKLLDDMLTRVTVIEKTVEKIALRAPEILAAHREKLSARMAEYLNGVAVDESRLLSEVAVFADKCNIDEEITRLKSHIQQFRTIAKGDGVGKKLDFLIQEFNRESNTICSKSNDSKTTSYALELKCEIEKIREQVQNIE
ncbi:MAG: YicC family protein [Clostridia bacterium]|nr:YicC family protein [Clostridia bacterium]